MAAPPSRSFFCWAGLKVAAMFLLLSARQEYGGDLAKDGTPPPLGPG